MDRTLRVKKESLTELSTDELTQVAGGAPTKDCIQTLVQDCTPTLHACTTNIKCP
jgi:hypothetical protein